MKTLTSFAGQNYLITPAASPIATPLTSEPVVGEQPVNTSPDNIHAASIHNQLWLLILTGVVEANVQGNITYNWLAETLSFRPDLSGPESHGTSGPLTWAINRYTTTKTMQQA